MDVITAHQYGFQNVVATLGTAVTEQQLRLLRKETSNITLALDADAAGADAMLRFIGYKNTFDADLKTARLPDGKDPDNTIREDAKRWQQLISDAIPVLNIDGAFDMVISKLDLKKVEDKVEAIDKLLDIIAKMKHDIPVDHYLNKLEELTGTSKRKLEAALSKKKPGVGVRKIDEKAAKDISQQIISSPVEEYCLALLFQHPALKSLSQQPSPEYFQNSENRAIFSAWQQASDLSSLKDKLDPTIWEHLDYLLSYLKKRGVPTNQIEARYVNCVLRLREEFLRSLEVKRGAALALEAELGGTTAELATLEEQGIEVSTQLGEVFSQKRGKRQGVEP